LLILICAALALITLIAYEPMRLNGFVTYDDDKYITDNPNVTNGLTQQSVLWAFSESHFHMWHPLTSLSHMLDCELFGLNPVGHHLTSLLFHIANSLLLFLLLRRLTGTVWRSAFVAAVFALHPLAVESVAWASERKSVLSTFFWMLTIAFYIWYAERPSIGRYLLLVLTFCCALMSKPMVVTLPFVLLLLDYWPLGRFRWVHKGRQKKPNYKICPTWQLLVEKIPLLGLAAILCVFTFFIQQSGSVMDFSDQLPLYTRLSNAVVSYVSYIVKMVYPLGLACLYPHPLDSLESWKIILSLVILVGISLYMIRSVQRRRWFVTGWLWYLGTLVPVIGIIQAGEQGMADRYTYLPLIGIFIIVAWGAGEVIDKLRLRKVGPAILVGIILAALLICTRMQIRHWRDNMSLCRHALKVTENNFTMHNNYGIDLVDEGRIDEGIAHFHEALRINPQYLNARCSLGRAFFKQGKFHKAIAYFDEVLRVRDNWPEVYYLLGLSYVGQKKYDLAIKNYNEAIRIKPDYISAINYLGLALKEQGKINEAIEKWGKVLQLEPNHPNVNYNMALALTSIGKYDDAVFHFKAALRSKSDWPDAYYNLGAVYYRQGKLELAVEQSLKALQLRPDYLTARINMAETLLQLGRIRQAVEQYYKILQFTPDSVDILNTLAWILATSNDDNIRNADDAFKFAQKACELADYNQPAILDTLAAAFAAAGRFSEAAKTTEKAISLTDTINGDSQVEEIRKHLQSYKAHRPWRTPEKSVQETSE